jgi:molybdopterin-guanine dinucleotide biosynthesis protein
LATPTDLATFRDNAAASSLDEIVAGLGATDIVLVEGFHEEARAKIEVLADQNDRRVCQTDSNLLAVVSPGVTQTTVPTFAPGAIKSLADFIEREFLARN